MMRIWRSERNALVGICLFLALALFGGNLSAQSSSSPTKSSAREARTESKSARKGVPVDQKYVRDKIRIFYLTEGPHAVDPTDSNQNGVPDQVEDVATQSWVAWRLWTSLGYTDPLQAPRYKGGSSIDVHLRSRDLLQANGIAYDEIQSAKKEGDPPGATCVRFAVATSVDPKVNLTPAHEMFHLFQYAVIFFKNSWFTEGTARWSQAALGNDEDVQRDETATWPPGESDLPGIYEASYKASSLYWIPLLSLADKVGNLPVDRLPKDLLEARYTNGELVIKDDKLVGATFLLDVFKALDKADDAVARQKRIQGWPEAEQRSPDNNPVIHETVLEVARKHGLIP